MKSVLSLVFGLLPASRAKNRLLTLVGHSVHPTARIHPTFVLGGTRLVIGPGARLGLLNGIRNVRRFELGEGCVVGQFNWFSAAVDLVAASSDPRAGTFVMERSSDLTSRHLLDVAGGVHVGEYTAIGGVRSTWITHGLDVETHHMNTGPITIGKHTMMGSNLKLVMGANVPAYSVVAMASLVLPGLVTEKRVYAGSPATERRELKDALFWDPATWHRPDLTS